MSDMSDLKCAACGEALERERYVPRQMLPADDMRVEQEDFREKLKRHNRYLHGWGVVCGLAVEWTDDLKNWTVRICPGYAVAPQGDEMVFSKKSASVFSTTEIDDVLRRMGIEHLVVTGIVTDGCVELSSRDAADRGYRVTLVSDACSASTPEAHEDAIARMTDGSFIAARTTEDVVADVAALRTPAAV